MKTITPDTLLPVGTRVLVKDKYGTVVSAEMVQGIPCGMIAYHMIKYDSKRTFVRDSKTGESGYVAKPIEEYTQAANYSFIQVV
jgi:hypothetical protein